MSQLSPLYRHMITQLMSHRSQGEDHLIWHQNKAGVFTIKEFYGIIRRRATPVLPLKLIWNNWLPPKVSIFIWKFYHRCIPTDDIIRSKGIPIVSKCQCCPCPSIETQDHIFFSGKIATEIWSQVSAIFDKPRPLSSVHFWADWMRADIKHSFIECAFFAVACCVIWELWLYRNKKKMDDVSRNCFAMLKSMISNISLKWKPPSDCSVIASNICNTFHIKSVHQKAILCNWPKWFPHPWGLTLSCAINKRDEEFFFGYIIRNFQGLFICAACFPIPDDDLLLSMASIDLPIDIVTDLSCFQSSHPDVCCLSSDSQAWKNIRLWRKIKSKFKHSSFKALSPLENNTAISISYLGTSVAFNSLEHIPFHVRNSYLGDIGHLPGNTLLRHQS